MKRIGKAIYLLLILMGLTAMASAQVATGVPPFSTINGGPFDGVNLGNLNVGFAIPIVSKPGRGIPFGFSLDYNSSVWAIGSSNGHSAWVPVGGTFLGWQGTGTITPYVSYTVTLTTNLCGPSNGGPPPYSFQQAAFGTTYVYHDQWGGQHSFSVSQTYYSIYNSPGIANSCPPNGPQPNNSQSALASDSSGYTLTMNPPSGTSITGYVVDRSGNIITTPTVVAGNTPPPGGYTLQDPNGNQLTFNGSSVFTDTMGNSVLSIGSGPSGGVTYTYSAPGGSTAFTVWYMLVPIQTQFGCSGVAEFSNVGQQSNTYLAYNIALPDGTSYAFTYETTPGNSNYYTGRIKSITLPTGGQITYNYTGNNYGINCSDGSTMGLTRTLAPGGTWTYTRTLVSGSHWQTKISSPPDSQNAGSASDDTVIDFQKNSSGNFYETQRQAYQGSQSSGNLLLTTVTCWNGNTSNCTTTAVSSPISERAVTTKFPNNGQASEVDSFFNNYGLLTETDQHAYGANGTPGSVARKTQISYASLGNIADHPASVTVTDGIGNLLSKMTYAYDEYSTYPLQVSTGTPQHVSVSGSRGNATTISSTVIGSSTLSRHVEYFDTGTVYEAIDVNGAITTYNYPDATSTCGNAFATSVTPPISGLSTSVTWNCAGAVLTSVTDANGHATNTSYTDPYFWRAASVQDPAGATTNFTYNPKGQNLANIDSKMLFNNGASVVEQLTTVNQFGPSCVFTAARRPEFIKLGFRAGAL